MTLRAPFPWSGDAMAYAKAHVAAGVLRIHAPGNLSPVTGPENIRHSYANGRTRPWSNSTQWRGRQRLTSEQIARARTMRADGVLLKEIAAELGISTTHAHRITARGPMNRNVTSS